MLCNKQQQERSPPLSPRPKPLSTVRELSKTQPFLGHFYIKIIILPRLARDKHRENSKKAPFLAPVYILKPIVLPRQARDKHREKSTQKERERDVCVFFSFCRSNRRHHRWPRPAESKRGHSGRDSHNSAVSHRRPAHRDHHLPRPPTGPRPSAGARMRVCFFVSNDYMKTKSRDQFCKDRLWTG